MPNLVANLPYLLRAQSKQCGRQGSILYSELLERAAKDVESGGTCLRILREFSMDPPRSALALRFLGAVNRLVLEGGAPDLVPCYAGDILDPGETWSRFEQVLRHYEKDLPALIRHPVRTNEPMRAAALLPGFLEVARETGLPLRLLEAGAGVGINLRWDHYFYAGSDQAWGEPSSPVQMEGIYKYRHPSILGDAYIIERSGCDAHPLHAASAEDRLSLLSFVWPDNANRVRRMRGALDLAQRIPVTIDTAAHAEEWIALQLKRTVKRQVTVVFHCMLMDHLSQVERAGFQFMMEEAGKRAAKDAPLAWLRMEPGGVDAEIRLRMWPGGADRLIANAASDGHWVESPSA